MATRVLILLALCVLPALVTSRPLETPYEVSGRIYCDTCRLGCEHPLVTYIQGAKVKIECKNRNTNDVVYAHYGLTDKEGRYTIEVREDHKDQICDAVLVESSQKDCAEIVPGLERARVVVAENNGIKSCKRYANSLGFRKNEASEGCGELAELYNSEV